MIRINGEVSVFSAYVTPALLLASGLIAAGIGLMILLSPNAFYASYGIDIDENTSLINELKEPAGTLLLAGLMMMAGVFRPALKVPSLGIAAAVYLSYGLSRILSMAMDGVPHSGLASAALFEVAFGGICLAVLVRHRKLTIAQRNAN